MADENKNDEKIAMRDEFLKPYAERLETQYYDKPRARAQVEGHAAVFFELMDFYKSIIKQLDIDSAKGVWLDNIGRILGFSRYVDSIIPKPFFSFKSNYIYPAGFSDKFDDAWIGGEFFEQGKKTNTSTTLEDGKFRRCLKAKAAKNNSGGFLVANYNDLRNYRISINDVTVDLFEGSALVTESHMSLNLYADQDEISIVDLSLFISGDLLPHPMGVYYGFILYRPSENFGFEKPFKGFGDKTDGQFGGTFAERITKVENLRARAAQILGVAA